MRGSVASTHLPIALDEAVGDGARGRVGRVGRAGDHQQLLLLGQSDLRLERLPREERGGKRLLALERFQPPAPATAHGHGLRDDHVIARFAYEETEILMSTQSVFK
eukprot:4840058-Pyramimonas_sp.AAC.1